MGKEGRVTGSRKLLIASLGVATVNYALYSCSPSNQTDTSGNLMAPPPTSGNLIGPPPDAGYDAASGSGGEGGSNADATTGGEGGEGGG